ncbi:MFS transporter [Fischerella sp. NIES-3754]|uniref:MFS transporter n=1 Tax=Fischerella sp. NIES-3754 TaxID=1752063 RepID=UPI0007209087|nr:MFS transporter [Fischerella sp. NIES-3754]BAU08906.1 major facilitator transporter [Fischerella sp. NIES-3754]BCX06384.1 MAG: MFS transporter [Fischerella sp.]
MKAAFARSLPRNVWFLGFVSLLADVNSKMIQSVLPLFLVSVLGTNLITVGFIEGIAESTASVLKVFSGALSDYWGRRKELAVAGYGLSTLVTPLFALSTSPAWVLVARFLDRIGKGVRVSPRNALVADVTPVAQRGAAYGLRQSLDTIGAFLGPLIATALLFLSAQNFRLVFWCAVLPGIIAIALLVFGVHESLQVSEAKHNPLQWSALKSLGKDYWMLVVVALLFNLGNSSDAFLLLRAQQIGIPTSLIPLSFVVMNLTYGLSAYPIGVLSDRIGRLGLLIAGFTLFAFVYLGLTLAQTPWQIWGLFALYGLYLGKTQGLLLALVADQVPDTLRGTAFGLINLVTGVAILPASLFAGILWQKVGYQATFMFGSVLAIAAILVLVLSFRCNHKFL